MKIAILSYGSRGDVQPFVALGVGLQAAGYKVTLATPPRFGNFIESYGLGFTPLAGDPKYGDFEVNRRLKSVGLGRLFLHASRLSVQADHLERPLGVSAPLPDDRARVLLALGIDPPAAEGAHP